MSRFTAIGLLLVCLISACSDGSRDQRTYVLTTGTTGGTFYPVGVALSTLVSAKIEEDFALTAIYLFGTKLFVKLFILSFIIIIFSFLFIIFIIYDKYFLGSQVPGWATLAILITFSGSLNIFFCCLITFFSSKLGSILSINPNYIIEK